MLRMIAVDWDVDPPRIAAAAKEPLRAETASDGKLRFHASTHDRIPVDGEFLFAQVAVEDAIDVRYAKDGRPLRPIESVDDGKVWWVEEPDAFASYRTAGSLHLLIDTVECEIEIRPSELSSAEFDELLADFSGTLWEILMAEESAVVISGVRDVGDNCAELVRRLERFVRAVRGVLAAPHRTLESAIIIDRPGKIRPIPATYHDRLRRPAARRLIGRSQHEIFDTAENRYLLRLCQWAQEVAARCQLAASRKGRDLEQCLAAGRRQIETMDGTDPVSLGDLRDRIEREERRIAQWTLRKQQWLAYQADTPESGPLAGCREMELEFWGASTRAVAHGFVTCSTEDCGVQLPQSLWPARVIEPQQKYRVRGLFREEEWGYSAPVYRAVALRDLDLLIAQPLTRYREYEAAAQRDHLETARIPLSPKSRAEQLEERKALSLRADAIASAATQWATRAAEADRVLGELRSTAALVRKQLGVRPSSAAPASVVYLRNPRYTRVLAAYRAAVGNQAVPIEKLLQVDEWGVLDIPAVYERWCLVRIVHVLLALGYRPAGPGWKSILVEALGNKSDPFAHAAVRLRNPDAAREIEVHYQGSLGRKRPDLMLVVTSLAAAGRSWRFILDSKFKPLTSRLGPPDEPPMPMTIQHELRDMLAKYRGTGNLVFIVHPSEKAFPGPKDGAVRFTSQFGGVEVLHADDRPDHRYGAIFAKPGAVDGLHAVVGMALQYSMEDNSSARDAELEHPRFCLICGSTRLANVPAPVPTKGDWWQCQEPDCGRRIIQHYCQNCGNRIWKHGTRWTYHETLLGDPYNIRCPHCGAVYVSS